MLLFSEIIVTKQTTLTKELINSTYNSQSEGFKHNPSLVIIQFFEIKRGQTSHFLELIGHMYHAAVLQYVGNFSKIQVII